jgi:hypothetical protein
MVLFSAMSRLYCKSDYSEIDDLKSSAFPAREKSRKKLSKSHIDSAFLSFLCSNNKLFYGRNSITKLYDLLSVKLGKETAENLTNFIETKINQGLESKISILATKEDLAKFTISENKSFANFTISANENFAKFTISANESFANFTISANENFAKFTISANENFANFTLAIKEEFVKFKEETKEDLARLKLDVAGLDGKIKESKGETIKWMFLFWIGQVAATFGFILLFLKK